jgi:hypothetical protein
MVETLTDHLMDSYDNTNNNGAITGDSAGTRKGRFPAAPGVPVVTGQNALAASQDVEKCGRERERWKTSINE